MKVTVFDGTKAKADKVVCNTFEEAEKLMRECALKPLASLYFGYEDSECPEFEEAPILSVDINGESATLSYYYVEADEDDAYECDDYEEEGEPCLWFSIGNHKDNVRFLNGKGMKTTYKDGEYVVTLEQAIECVKQFYKSNELPDCIEWDRIS